MKNFKRFLSVMVAMLLVTVMASALSVSAASKTYNCELTDTVATAGYFKYMAYDVATGTLVEVEQTAGETWDTKLNYIGFHVPGFVKGENYITCSPESPGKGFVDLMPQNAYGAAIVFTAPEAGTYTIDLGVYKQGVGSTQVDVALMKGETVLWEEKNFASTDITPASVADVELAAGEQVYLLVLCANECAGAQNVGVESFSAKIPGEGDDETTEPEDTENDTTAPENTEDDDTTTEKPDDDKNVTTAGDKEEAEEDKDGVDPLLIVGIVAAVLVIAAVVVVIIVKNKKK